VGEKSKTRDEIILEIKLANDEHDWDEVIRLYKLLFSAADKKAS